MRSVHERHRLALTELQAGTHLRAVARVARALGIEAQHPPVALSSALRSGQGPFAEMVLALGPRPQDAVSVECWVCRPDRVDAPYLAKAGAVGWVSVAPITDDPVAATAARLGGAENRLVSYHRGRRATVRVTGPTGLRPSPVAYAKVFSDQRGAEHLELSEPLAEAAAAGRLGVRVPQPARYDATRFVLWQHQVAGVPSTDLLTGPRGPVLALQLGAALGSLHTSGLQPPRRLTATGLMLRTERHAAEASRLVPALGKRILRLLGLVGADASDALAPTVPVHGSPEPARWLVGAEPVPGLLDLDRLAWGEPETDLACFLVEAGELGCGLSSAAVSAGFLAGYQSATGPIDPEALRRHSTMRLIGTVLRAARAVQADGDLRATRVLGAAERAVARPPGLHTGAGR
ncbi:MAG: phosphotransferase family protein [Nocardioides sp.]